MILVAWPLKMDVKKLVEDDKHYHRNEITIVKKLKRSGNMQDITRNNSYSIAYGGQDKGKSTLSLAFIVLLAQG